MRSSLPEVVWSRTEAAVYEREDRCGALLRFGGTFGRAEEEGSEAFAQECYRASRGAAREAAIALSDSERAA